MIELLTNIGIVAGAILGLGVIWTSGIRPIFRAARKLGDVHDYITVDLPAWQKEVDKGLKQLYPNSGSSIHDKVMCTNTKVEETGRKVEETSRSLDAVRAMLEEHLNDRDMHRTGPNPIVNVNMAPDRDH